MIEFPNGGRMPEAPSELPQLAGARVIYLDVETTSGDRGVDALNPWDVEHCRAAGLAVTIDECPEAWYVPVAHHASDRNLPRDVVIRWLEDAFSEVEWWCNHNVKYDAHVVANDLGVRPRCGLRDTLTLAKIVDSDRLTKGGYGLKTLSRDWLREDIDYLQDPMTPYLHRNKDWGRVPADVMGHYACQDALSVRRLWRYESGVCPSESRRVWDTEVALTSVLVDVEREGLRVDPEKLKVAELTTLHKMLLIEEKLEEITGRPVLPHVSADCFDVLCNQYGMPVLAYTNEGKDEGPHNPSFDKAAMAKYSAHPLAPREVVDLMLEYRKLHTFLNFFVTPYQRLQVDGLLHSDYNQAVRTGRMSCRNPNAQQLDKNAKRLIVAAPGESILTCDYSQIEFRIIVHYIKNRACIEAYARDPDTDFHQWVADMIPMPRRPAKNVNFMMGYGGGRGKCVAMLASNKDVVGSLLEEVERRVASGELAEDQRMAAFDAACQRRAGSVYDAYHSTLAELRPTTYDASAVCRHRGFVRNLRGRRRHLPEEASHLAFNSLCQSSAADIMKERTVALHEALRGTPIKIIASVHDDTVLRGPSEVLEDPEVVGEIVRILEDVDVDMRVPIRCNAGVSRVSWYHAGLDESVVPHDRTDRGRLAALRSG